MLELRATPSGGEKYCLEVDGSKIGVLPEATNAKVGRCRSIPEQQFRLINDAEGSKRLELRATPSGGEKYCLEVDGSKIGVLPEATNAKVGRCRSIPEQQFRLINDAEGSKRLELRATPSGGEKYCLEVDGSKIGVLPEATNAKVGRCRSIPEQQFQIN